MTNKGPNLLMGVTKNAFGKELPCLCAAVTPETADEVTAILGTAVPAAETGQLPQHPLAQEAIGETYDVRLYGCMSCGEKWSILAPRKSLRSRFTCPTCAPSEAINISELYSDILAGQAE